MQTLHEAQLSLAVPKGHKYADYEQISFHDISNETLLYLSEQEAPVQHALLPFSYMEVIEIITTGSNICQIWKRLYRWCEANRGVAFIARDYCAASLENLILIPIADAMPISLNLVYNPKHISGQLKKLQKMMGDLS